MFHILLWTQPSTQVQVESRPLNICWTNVAISALSHLGPLYRYTSSWRATDTLLAHFLLYCKTSMVSLVLGWCIEESFSNISHFQTLESPRELVNIVNLYSSQIQWSRWSSWHPNMPPGASASTGWFWEPLVWKVVERKKKKIISLDFGEQSGKTPEVSLCSYVTFCHL